MLGIWTLRDGLQACACAFQALPLPLLDIALRVADTVPGCLVYERSGRYRAQSQSGSRHAPSKVTVVCNGLLFGLHPTLVQGG